jgi:hypothetical protein
MDKIFYLQMIATSVPLTLKYAASVQLAWNDEKFYQDITRRRVLIHVKLRNLRLSHSR